jgi:xanthine dehydrogenase accessory factor
MNSASPSWERLAQAAHELDAPVVVTVVETSGSTPRKTGARMLVEVSGACPEDDAALPSPEGTVGGGAVEAQAIRLAFEAWAAGHPRVQRIALGAEMGMCCGGSMTLMAQPLVERPTLLIFGLGHVGMALARLAAPCGFRVVGIDARAPQRAEAEPWLEACHVDFDPETLALLPEGPHVHALIVTHDHGLDQTLVEQLIERAFGSLQMLGSMRKALRFKTRLEAQGFPAETIAKLRSPAGLDIGSETPAEIAVSLMAELIKKRRA